jgi:hypothetical protein
VPPLFSVIILSMVFLRTQYGKFLTVGIIFFVMGLAIYSDPIVWALGILCLVIGLVGLVSKRRLG